MQTSKTSSILESQVSNYLMYYWVTICTKKCFWVVKVNKEMFLGSEANKVRISWIFGSKANRLLINRNIFG